MAAPNTLSAVKRNTAESLGDQVLHRCRKMLMTGQFLPGQKLPLRPLAQEFNTSLMPVRDALNHLVADGALELSAGRTIRVPKMTEARVVELHEIRSALEGLAAEYATEHISRATIGRMETLIDEMANAFEAKTFAAYIEHHYSFHFTIYTAAGRATLLGLIETLWLQVGPWFRQGIEQARRAVEDGLEAGDPNSNHRKVVAALRARDAKATRAAIERDVMTGVDFYRNGVWWKTQVAE